MPKFGCTGSGLRDTVSAHPDRGVHPQKSTYKAFWSIGVQRHVGQLLAKPSCHPEGVQGQGSFHPMQKDREGIKDALEDLSILDVYYN